MNMSDPIMGMWFDAETGEIIERELTAEEIAALPQPEPDPE